MRHDNDGAPSAVNPLEGLIADRPALRGKQPLTRIHECLRMVVETPMLRITGLRTALAFALALSLATTTLAQTSGVTGIWWTPKHDGKIEIVVDATGTASGRIIALSPDDADKRDARNVDAALRDRPVLGLTILGGFRQEANGTWTGGTAYDPEGGRTYRGTLALDRDGHLRMRGYIGISWFGRTEVLARVVGPSPRTQQPGEPVLVYQGR